jgi:outer membrane protein assembly factor BamB
MHLIRLLSLLLVAFTAGCDLLLGDDDDGDPGLVGDAGGTVYRLSGGVDTVDVIWTADVAVTDSISFATAGSTVIVAAGSRVHGFAEDSGDELWTADVIDQVVALTQGDGRAYALSFTALTAIDVDDGSIVWTLDFTADAIVGVSFADPVFSGSAVILGGDPVRRVDAASGIVSATYATSDTEMLGLAADGSEVFVGTRNGIFGLSGGLDETWSLARTDDVDRIVPTPAGIFYSQVGAGVGLVSDAGAALWNEDDGAVYEALVAGEGVVVGARLQGTVHAFNPTDGTSLWSVDTTSSPVRGLAVSGTTVLYGGGMFVQGLDLNDGSVLWEWSPGAGPVGVAAL